MDLTHIILIFAVLVILVVVFLTYRTMIRGLERDEAIDAATLLALRQLDEYVKSTRQSPPKPSSFLVLEAS